MTDTERALFRAALDLWGAEAQVGMLHEEIGELLMVVNKVCRESPGAAHLALRGNALEEIEDVRIMLDQMIVLLGSTDDHQDKLRDYKIERLSSLMHATIKHRERVSQ